MNKRELKNINSLKDIVIKQQIEIDCIIKNRQNGQHNENYNFKIYSE